MTAALLLTFSINPGTALATPPSDEQGVPYTVDEGVGTQAYPVGCGLHVFIRRDGNYVFGSTFTGCNFAVVKIEMRATIQRSRWYGWQTMAEETNVGYNRFSLPNDVTYNCSGTGVYDYKVVATGTVTLANGTTASAGAYDRIDGVHC